MAQRAVLVYVVLQVVCSLTSSAASPLELVQKIPLQGVVGRLDHIALDPADQRLFVAAHDNNTVEVVDLPTSKVTHELAGLKQPQGIVVVPEPHEVVVANGGDGSVRFYDAASMQLTGRLELAGDADNIRFDSIAGLLYVGFGDGAIAVVDPRSSTVVSAIPLSGHPEAFALEQSGSRLFVNVPTAKHVAVLNRSAGSVLSVWTVQRGFDDFFRQNHYRAVANFPMAIDEERHRLFVGYRRPPSLLVFDTGTQKPVAQIVISGDADDIVYDSSTKRLYVACGEGFIDVVETVGDGYERVAREPTAPGARTALFDSVGRRMYVAVPADSTDVAAIFVYAVK